MNPLTIVIAIGPGGLIGKDGKVPWRVPEDMKHFRRVTTGHTVIMGRKTFDDIGKPLPNRRNIVVSRTPREIEGVDHVESLEEALALARLFDHEPCVIGGAQIYKLALPIATRIFLTEISGVDTDGDTFFDLDGLDSREWTEVSAVQGEDPRAYFVELARK